MRTLPCHILLELEYWYANTHPQYSEGHSSPSVLFDPHTEISYGEFIPQELTTHLQQRVYVEEGRFKPTALRIVEVEEENTKLKHSDESFQRKYALYQHPDRQWFCNEELTESDASGEVSLTPPFDYHVKDLLPAYKADLLIERRSATLQHASNTLAQLLDLESWLQRKGVSLPPPKINHQL